MHEGGKEKKKKKKRNVKLKLLTPYIMPYTLTTHLCLASAVLYLNFFFCGLDSHSLCVLFSYLPTCLNLVYVQLQFHVNFTRSYD